MTMQQTLALFSFQKGIELSFHQTCMMIKAAISIFMLLMQMERVWKESPISMGLMASRCLALMGNFWFLHPIAIRKSTVIPIFLFVNGNSSPYNEL